MKQYFLLLFSFIFLQAEAAPVLVSTDWLAANLGKKNIVLVDTSDYTQHQRFHIPGAIHIDYGEFNYRRKPDGVSVQVPNNYFTQLLGKKGISSDSYIVIYDDMGGLNAGRLFWQLEQIGHAEISVVDGGLVKWILENRKVSNDITRPSAVQYIPKGNGKNNLIHKTEISNASALLIDARSREEYAGDPRIPRSGHIPGALLWDWQDNVDFENAFTLKKPETIAREQKNINFSDKNKPVIAYCRSGHRAAQTYLTLRAIGFDNIRLYDGSMSEYEADKKAPLEKGCSRC